MYVRIVCIYMYYMNIIIIMSRSVILYQIDRINYEKLGTIKKKKKKIGVDDLFCFIDKKNSSQPVLCSSFQSDGNVPISDQMRFRVLPSLPINRRSCS